MNTPDALTQYRAAVSELKALRRQLNALGEDGPREAEALIKSRESALAQTVFTFERLLERVESPRDRAVLRLFYGAGETDAAIADELRLSERQIVRIRKSAVERLSFLP